MLPRGRLKDRAGIGAEPHIDGFGFGFVGPFPIRTMAFRGVCVAGATRLATLHSPLQHGSLTEILQILKFLLEFQESLGIAIQGGSAGTF